eukprot:15331506-Ditylum_brightwellii.AAC.1
MDILESASPMGWCDKMRSQRFDCTAKGQAKFINFRDNLKCLEPTKVKKRKLRPKQKSTKNHEEEKKWQYDSMASLTANMAKRKGLTVLKKSV